MLEMPLSLLCWLFLGLFLEFGLMPHRFCFFLSLC